MATTGTGKWWVKHRGTTYKFKDKQAAYTFYMKKKMEGGGTSLSTNAK